MGEVEIHTKSNNKNNSRQTINDINKIFFLKSEICPNIDNTK